MYSAQIELVHAELCKTSDVDLKEIQNKWASFNEYQVNRLLTRFHKFNSCVARNCSVLYAKLNKF